jgi:hypothetical protein
MDVFFGPPDVWTAFSLRQPESWQADVRMTPLHGCWNHECALDDENGVGPRMGSA